MNGTDHCAKLASFFFSFRYKLAHTIRRKFGNRRVRSARETLNGCELGSYIEMAFSSETNVVSHGSQVIDDASYARSCDSLCIRQSAVVDWQQTSEELGSDWGTLGDSAVETVEDERLFRQRVDRRSACRFGSRATEGIVTNIIGNDDENIGTLFRDDSHWKSQA